MKKVVGMEHYQRALEEIPCFGQVRILNAAGDEEPVHMEVFVGGQFAMTPEESFRFAENIKAAACTARDFKYNGYYREAEAPSILPSKDAGNVERKELAQMLNGREYSCCCFDDVKQFAKNKGLVIISGASDDLIVFDGALVNEAGMLNGGAVSFDSGGVSSDPDEYDNQILAIWCGSAGGIQAGFWWEFVTEEGKIIPWCYKTDIPHETFLLYEDGEPYCRGLVISLKDLK